jgi:hypothetical protein
MVISVLLWSLEEIVARVPEDRAEPQRRQQTGPSEAVVDQQIPLRRAVVVGDLRHAQRGPGERRHHARAVDPPVLAGEPARLAERVQVDLA